jgi:hypothetical protein
MRRLTIVPMTLDGRKDRGETTFGHERTRQGRETMMTPPQLPSTMAHDLGGWRQRIVAVEYSEVVLAARVGRVPTGPPDRRHGLRGAVRRNWTHCGDERHSPASSRKASIYVLIV